MRLTKYYLTNAQGHTAQLREQWILQKERGFGRQLLHIDTGASGRQWLWSVR